jgi:hypothetical protein
VISKEQRTKFIEEHLPYEFSMLEHTFQRLHQVQEPADWNAFLESFCIHARNVKDFFIGDRGAANNGVIANDLISFVNLRIPNALTGTFQRLNEQITHMSRHRPTDGNAKFTRAHAEKVMAWLRPQLEKFLNDLSPYDKEQWNAASKNPKRYLISPSDTVPGASSTIVQVTSTTLPAFPVGTPYRFKL